jgi:hypothetical protein
LTILSVVNGDTLKSIMNSTLEYQKEMYFEVLAGSGELPDEEVNKIKGFVDEMYSDYENIIDYNELQRRMFPIYDENYTEDEINAAYDFYTSEHGSSYAKKITQVAPDTQRVMTEYVQELLLFIEMKAKEGGYGEDFKF